MKNLEIPISSLLPIQTWLYGRAVAEAEDKVRTTGGVKTIPVVSYPDVEGSDYIMLDGHHASVGAYFAGRLTVPGQVIMTTEELFATRQIRFMMQRMDITGIDDLRDWYTDDAYPQLAEAGVVRIADLALTDFRYER